MKDKTMEETVIENKNSGATLSKKTKLTLIILAVALVICVAGMIVGSFLVPKSIEGSWELTVNPEVAIATEDEIEESDRVYYVFEKPDRYGSGQWYICYDGGIEYYKYEFVMEDSVEKINLGSENLEYKITGSKLLGNAKVTLVYPGYTDENTGAVYEAEEYILEQVRMPDYKKEAYKTYEVDEDLIGEWANNQRSLSYYHYSFYYTETISISDNGIMTIHYKSDDLQLDRYMYYAYTAEDSELTFSLVTDKDTKYAVKYEFDENGNLKFIDDITAASIFADEFFGDVTYFTP